MAEGSFEYVSRFLQPWISSFHGLHYPTTVIPERILGSIQLHYIYLIASSDWSCYMQQRLFHSHTSFHHSPPSCPSIFKALMYTSFSCQKLYILFSHSCILITATKNIPRNIWHWSETVAVPHDRGVLERSVSSSTSPGGKRSYRGAIHIWEGLVNSSDLCSRGRRQHE